MTEEQIGPTLESVLPNRMKEEKKYKNIQKLHPKLVFNVVITEYKLFACLFVWFFNQDRSFSARKIRVTREGETLQFCIFSKVVAGWLSSRATLEGETNHASIPAMKGQIVPLL